MGAAGSKKLSKRSPHDMFEPIKRDKRGLVDYKPTVLDLRKLEYLKIHDAGFFGEWSQYSNFIGMPKPRVSHFTAYDEKNEVLYVGLGVDSKLKYIEDIWAFDSKIPKWSRVPVKYIKGSKLCKRVNPSACFLDGMLYIFGGFCIPDYSNDLQMIDVKTGKMTLLTTKGDVPIPMSMNILAGYDRKLVMWGGFDRNYHTDMYVLSLDTLTWVKKETPFHKRTSVPYTVYGKDLYSFGGSDNNTLLHIDLDEEKIEEIEVNGFSPPNDVQSANISSSKDYLFWLGGRSSFAYSYMLVMSKKTKKWSILHLRPDNESVFVDDGKLDQLNLFALPLFENFSFQYIEDKRSLIAVLGKSTKNSDCINIFNIQNAISFLNMREDMCDALQLTITE